MSWGELEQITGGLPSSATRHRAFWAGDRSLCSGFRTTDVRVGESVTFVRHNDNTTQSGSSPPVHPDSSPSPNTPDLIPVSCAKTKLDHPTQAQELYTSALFRKARSFVQAAGGAWVILSAMYGTAM